MRNLKRRKTEKPKKIKRINREVKKAGDRKEVDQKVILLVLVVVQ